MVFVTLCDFFDFVFFFVLSFFSVLSKSSSVLKVNLKLQKLATIIWYKTLHVNSYCYTLDINTIIIIRRKKLENKEI